MLRLSILVSLLTLILLQAGAQNSLTPLQQKLKTAADQIESKSIEWRRHLHQYPELSNREFKTARMIADHLKSLGMDVQENVAKTGVVGVLKGGKPGPVIGLRADMDALPVAERSNLAFASKQKGDYNGKEVSVMHACGHDTHVAMLMSVAEILSGVKKDINGTIKFIFQPAEEGPPEGEEGGAPLMVKEGVLKNPDVDIMLGLHINAQTPVGTIKYKEEGMMAASDWFTIKVKGKQSHGSQPWLGVDPVVVSAQIISGLQTIVSRQTELTKNAAVISVCIINGGVRANIIPEEVEMTGTIRTLDKDMQKQIHERIKTTAEKIAESSGATAVVDIENKTLVTYNDPVLTRKLLPSLIKAAGKDNVLEMNAVTGAEDFSFFAEKIPSLYLYVGGLPSGKDPREAAAHHTPDFYVDDAGMKTGILAFLMMVTDYMNMEK
ncbi:MAG: amidohydrolase [Chitinophagaceae bacterium]|jgi:amidohydrolase|nr:amidohydrolase [Chitinophagaceae bacterium]